MDHYLAAETAAFRKLCDADAYSGYFNNPKALAKNCLAPVATSQAAWLTYRDAECGAETFNAPGDEQLDGSMTGQLASECETTFNLRRAALIRSDTENEGTPFPMVSTKK
jgi:uncharacterized protein YecT (DUF1311 family)